MTDHKHEAAIHAAAQSQARAELALQAVMKRVEEAGAATDAVTTRLEQVRDQVLAIRVQAEGSALTDAQAGRVHLLTLDEHDLSELLATNQRKTAAVRAEVQEAQDVLVQAKSQVHQAQSLAQVDTLRAQATKLEELLCSAVLALFQAHVASGGHKHFISAWRPSEVLNRMVAYGEVPRV